MARRGGECSTDPFTRTYRTYVRLGPRAKKKKRSAHAYARVVVYRYVHELVVHAVPGRRESLFRRAYHYAIIFFIYDYYPLSHYSPPPRNRRVFRRRARAYTYVRTHARIYVYTCIYRERGRAYTIRLIESSAHCSGPMKNGRAGDIVIAYGLYI